MEGVGALPVGALQAGRDAPTERARTRPQEGRRSPPRRCVCGESSVRSMTSAALFSFSTLSRTRLRARPPDARLGTLLTGLSPSSPVVRSITPLLPWPPAWRKDMQAPVFHTTRRMRGGASSGGARRRRGRRRTPRAAAVRPGANAGAHLQARRTLRGVPGEACLKGVAADGLPCGCRGDCCTAAAAPAPSCTDYSGRSATRGCWGC